MVQLGQGIGDTEIFVEIAQQLHRGIQGETSLVFLARGGPYPDRRAAGRPFLYRSQIADDEHQQVGRHNRSFGKTDRLQSRAGYRFFHHRGIGNGLVFVGENQGHFKGGLLSRLVPAGEGPAGVGGFELGGGQVAGLAVLGGVLRPVETHQLVVEFAFESHLQPGVAGLDGFPEV